MRPLRCSGWWLALLPFAALACSSSGDPTTPPAGNPDPPGGPNNPTSFRLTVEIPLPIDGAVNSSTHGVVVVPGTNPPANRAAVSVKPFQCSSVSDAAVTCEYDIPRNQFVALVAEEGRSFGSVRALGSGPPNEYPAEFVDWQGDVAGVVEEGFLRLPMDRARRIVARFRTMQPMTVHMEASDTETIFFRTTMSVPPLLTLPPSTVSSEPFNSPSYGGSESFAVMWFFMKTGSTVTIEPRDDINAQGCVPSASSGCAKFIEWSGACTGAGNCVLTPTSAPQAVFAKTARVFAGVGRQTAGSAR